MMRPLLLLFLNSIFNSAIGLTPTREIAPGVHMPLVGLGTWLYNSSVTADAVKTALSLGYTHIDTALGYKNAKGVAEALRGSKRPRSTYFITSKIPGGLGEAQALMQAEQNIADLGIKYVDLMLVHFPATWQGSGGKAARQAEWLALEKLVAHGKARAIGVSHYCQRHLEDILEVATVRPALNQVEYHVGMGSAGPNATDSKDWYDAHGITYMGFSPLCGPCGPGADQELIDGDLVTTIGQKYNKTGAQVALKWQVQQGIPIVPKSNKRDHQFENLDLFDLADGTPWVLSSSDMASLSGAKTPPVSGGGDGKTSGDCAVA